MSDLLVIKEIKQLYKKGNSAAEIGKKLGYSWRKIIYLMQKHNIKRRSHSEATYRKLNPNGHPFKIKDNLTRAEQELRALGLGLFLGEGAKSNSLSVRLSNSDPALINVFLNFLKNICGVKAGKIKLWLTLHSDLPQIKAEEFWALRLNTPLPDFKKHVILNHGNNGSGRKKSAYGTATVCVHNMKLRGILDNWVNDSVKRHS